MLLLLPVCADAGAALALPEVDGWTCGEARVTELVSVGGVRGAWSEREYRTLSGMPLRAVLMTGSGPRATHFPKPGIEAGEGPLGSGSVCKTFEIAGRPTIAETHPILGVSLTVALDGGYLTVENASGIYTAEEIAGEAAVIIEQMHADSQL